MSTPGNFPPIGPKNQDKFTPELRILVASLLSVAVILLWTKFFAPKPPAYQPPKEQPAVTAPATSGTAETPPPSTKVPAAPGAPVVAPAQPVVPAAAIADSQEHEVVVESPLYRVTFSNRGAVVKSWVLKKYKDDNRDEKGRLQPRPLDLANPDLAHQPGEWPFSLVFDNADLQKAANSGLFKVSVDRTNLEAPADVTFTWSDGHLEVTKKFHFENSYVVTTEISATNNGARVMAGLAWRGWFGDWTVTDPAPATTINAFYGENGKISVLPAKKLDDPEKVGGIWQGGKTFTGIEDRYFTVAFLAPTDAMATPLQTRYWKEWPVRVVKGKDQSEPVPQIATATNAEPMALRVFVGPKDYDDLKAMRPPLNGLVQFGWLEFIADPLFHGLKWLYKYIPNWGWAIVVLTVVINMVLFPLRISSYKTTMKMQRVAPEIKQIQEKYKKYKLNDPRKAEMNKEIMAIYSREGVNPVGGCFQMLFQMPIWFGLNTALRYAIELRQSSWLWVRDLASADPYYVLPIGVGLSMYLVSKMTPMTTTDPQQAAMMKFLPISMAVMFVIFPFSSGLALYILTSSLIGILQQWYLNRTHPLPAPAKPARAKK